MALSNFMVKLKVKELGCSSVLWPALVTIIMISKFILPAGFFKCPLNIMTKKSDIKYFIIGINLKTAKYADARYSKS